MLESTKLIGGKLMEEAGMIENNYLCIVAFDKLVVWGGSNIKLAGNQKYRCSAEIQIAVPQRMVGIMKVNMKISSDGKKVFSWVSYSL